MRISVTIGLTVKTGDGEYIKPTITYSEIDLEKELGPDKTIDQQLDFAKKTSKKVAQEIMDRLFEDIVAKLAPERMGE